MDAIDFDDEFSFGTVEIRYISCDTLLSYKAYRVSF